MYTICVYIFELSLLIKCLYSKPAESKPNTSANSNGGSNSSGLLSITAEIDRSQAPPTPTITAPPETPSATPTIDVKPNLPIKEEVKEEVKPLGSVSVTEKDKEEKETKVSGKELF